VNRILGVLGELEQKSDYVAREMQALNLRRQEALEQMRVDSWVFPLPPAEFAPLGTSLMSISGDALYAGDSQTLLADSGTGGPSIGSSHVSLRTTFLDEDAPATAHTPLSFSTINRNEKKRYRCQCGTETTRRSDMRRHQKYGRVHHSLPQFVCVCGRKYTRKDSHQNHKKECRGALQKAFSA